MGVHKKQGHGPLEFVRRFLSDFRKYGSRSEQAMTRAALLRYFCVHFQLAVYGKGDVYMKKQSIFNQKQNLEEPYIEYQRLRHGAEL